MLQDGIKSVSAWTRDWQMGFNKTKCVALRVRKNVNFTYQIVGTSLQRVTEQKDLGVSEALKASSHIRSAARKADLLISVNAKKVGDNTIPYLALFDVRINDVGYTADYCAIIKSAPNRSKVGERSW